MLEELQLIRLLGARSARPADTSAFFTLCDSRVHRRASRSGRSLNQDADIAASNLDFIKVRALFTNAHERPDCRAGAPLAAVIADSAFRSEQPDDAPLFQGQ